MGSWTTPPGEAAAHTDRRPHADRTVLLDPNAGGQHVCESPDKPLKKRQGLLILSYLERKDYDYLHALPRLVAVPVANVVNPSSNPVSFAVEATSAHRPRSIAVLRRRTEVSVRYAVIQ